MARYRVLVKRSAAKEIETISTKAGRERVVRRIQSLADDPRLPGCRKLSGKERYRVRHGDHRIIHSIEDDALLVYVVKVGHRRDVYRQEA